jgi:hypothetical protein
VDRKVRERRNGQVFYGSEEPPSQKGKRNKKREE